jgi:NAD(P)-dependent dehydrogenase (short-subunit alcohol dehydrogenase family)
MTNQRVAIITGTSSGFGALIAETLAKDGFRVFATMRDADGRNMGPKRKLESLGISVVEMDVTDQASVDAGAATILAATDRIDVLVNNAGTLYSGITEAFSPESLERQLATNVVGPHRFNRAFLPSMRKRSSGLVVFVSSIFGRYVVPYIGVYAASKWALEALAESMSYELRASGVDIAIVEPGIFATNIVNVMTTPDDTARAATYDAGAAKIMQAMGEGMQSTAGNAQDVADAILTLVNTPSPDRPLRTTVPAQSPAAQINDAAKPFQQGVLSSLGL